MFCEKLKIKRRFQQSKTHPNDKVASYIFLFFSEENVTDVSFIENKFEFFFRWQSIILYGDIKFNPTNILPSFSKTSCDFDSKVGWLAHKLN